MSSTPFSLFCDYRNLDVTLIDGITIYGIDIHEYRNYELKGGLGCEAGEEAYKKLKAKVIKYGLNYSSNLYEMNYPIENHPHTDNAVIPYDHVKIWPDLMRPYVGKGSPDEIRLALRLAVGFGLVKGTKAAIQDYCDKYIGLDCSGFAGNYLGNGLTGKPAAEFAPVGSRLSHLERVKSGTAIVWKNGKHVALVDQVVRYTRTTNGMMDSVDCYVAESTGDQMVHGGPKDGLNYTLYTLLPGGQMGTDKFKVMRSLAAAKKDYYYVDVYLANHA